MLTISFDPSMFEVISKDFNRKTKQNLIYRRTRTCTRLDVFRIKLCCRSLVITLTYYIQYNLFYIDFIRATFGDKI